VSMLPDLPPENLTHSRQLSGLKISRRANAAGFQEASFAKSRSLRPWFALVDYQCNSTSLELPADDRELAFLSTVLPRVVALIRPCELLAIRSGRGRCSGSRRCRGLTDDDEFERFSVDLELHFIFVEGKLDRCV
jgi:hypothetical protein